MNNFSDTGVMKSASSYDTGVIFIHKKTRALITRVFYRLRFGLD